MPTQKREREKSANILSEKLIDEYLVWSLIGMIEEGYRSKATKWGNFTVKKVVKLAKPVECYSEEKGKARFNPTMVKLEWDNPPSDDKNDIWFPYWITWVEVDGKERYGQFSPMIGEKAFLELMKGAIKKGFFTNDFLTDLQETIMATLQ